MGKIINCTNNGEVSGGSYVGGLCGETNIGTITNCANSGSITGSYVFGGICGLNGYNSTIENCISIGTVTDMYDSSVPNGVCGFNNSGTITNCYYDSTVLTGNAVGSDNGTTTNALGKTTAEFQSGEVAYLLQSAQTETDEEGNILHVWGQTIVEDTYPVLGGDKVYKHTSECGGTFYSNTENDTKAHLYDDNGFCTNADCEDPYQPATDTDENGVYEIANAGQLYWFMELVNNYGEIYVDIDAILTANITVNENVLNEDGTLAEGDFRAWFPIGYYDRDDDDDLKDIYYNGTFDGQGHTISGLYFDNTAQSFVGLFGQTESGAEICNVTVADSYFKGKNNVGGVCGRNYSGTITDCTNSGSVTGTDNVGGVCGYNDSGIITNCINSGSAEGNRAVGGVCGCNYKGTITNCTNSGSATGERHIGGVCGYVDSGTITNCVNSGSVDGSLYAGGVCGRNYNNGTITNCYYDSTVFTGGAVGWDSSTTTNALGKTTAEFKSGEVAYLLSQGCTIDPDASVEGDEVSYSGEIWGQTIGEDTYPVLGGDKVYQCESECGGTFYSNTENDTKSHHYDDNGFCMNCEDGYQPATDTNEDGEYEIANAGQLYWFMELVNSVEPDGSGIRYADYDAILTDDITVNKNVLNADGTLNGDGSNFREWFPIGYYYDCNGDSSSEDVYYDGAFDGQGYTISGLYFDNTAQDYVGLFGQIDSGAEICNVTVADSYFKGRHYVGGVCGYNKGTIKNSINSGSVTGTNRVGGVCGYNYFGTITNSTNSGSVEGTRYVGGVCGYNYKGTITNSTNSGSVMGESDVGGVCGYNVSGTITNCYYDSDVFTGNAVGSDNGTTTNTLGKTTAEFKTGEVAYLLQSAQTETDEEGNILHVWGQTIGEGTYPVLGGDKVYQCESQCGGTFYSNTENDTQAHAFDANGFCTNADCEDPYQPASDTNNDGVYEIANGGQLYWFMELVNSVEPDESGNRYADYDAILTADITVNKNVLNADGTLNGDGSNFRAWFPIGYYYNRNGDDLVEEACYNGTFDGQGHTISGLYFDNTAQEYVGLFGQIDSGATIKNVSIEDSYIGGKNYVGGVCGCNYKGTITNSTNSGSVTGTNHVGGVCGFNDSGTITNSTSSGNVTGHEYSIGGVCSYNSSGTITNCYFDSDVFTGSAVGYENGTTTNTLGKTTTEFQSGEVAYLLHQGCTVDPDSSVEGDEVFYSGEIWGQTIGEDTYPVLNGKKVFLCGTKYVNAHLDPCECTPINAELKIADEAAFVDTYTYGDTINITAEDFTTLSDPKQIKFAWQDADGDSLEEAPVNTGSYKLVVSIPKTYYNDILYAKGTLEIDITIGKAALEASNFTFTAPENLTYDGSEKTAVLESTLDGIGEMTLTYYDENGEPLEDTPVNAGTYTVKADVAEGMNYQAASAITDENWTFTIGKADLTKADLIVMGALYQVYDKNGNLFTVQLSDSLVGAGELTVTYANADGAVDGINGADTYTVTAAVSKGENYNAASFDWTVTIYKSLLTGITVDVTAPAVTETPQDTVEAGEGYTASITWDPADETFDYNTEYSVTVVLTPDADHQFTDQSEITAKGFDITRNEDGTITLTQTYGATVKAKITSLIHPKDVLLREHQPDADAVIDLLPAIVTIEAEDGTTELPITWTFDGDEYDITANAEHLFTWTADCGDLDENGFALSGQIIVTNPNYTDISEQIELTAEDITYGEVPKVSAIYGDTELDVIYSMDGETFEKPDEFLNADGFLPAGKYTVRASYESETEKGTATATFTVNKARPIIFPIFQDTDLVEGDPIPEITIDEDFSTPGFIEWTNGVQELIAGLNELYWKFTPDDTDNYEEASGTETVIAETTTTTTTETTASTTTESEETTTTVETEETTTVETEETTTTVETEETTTTVETEETTTTVETEETTTTIETEETTTVEFEETTTTVETEETTTTVESEETTTTEESEETTTATEESEETTTTVESEETTTAVETEETTITVESEETTTATEESEETTTTVESEETTTAVETEETTTTVETEETTTTVESEETTTTVETEETTTTVETEETTTTVGSEETTTTETTTTESETTTTESTTTETTTTESETTTTESTTTETTTTESETTTTESTTTETTTTESTTTETTTTESETTTTESTTTETTTTESETTTTESTTTETTTTESTTTESETTTTESTTTETTTTESETTTTESTTTETTTTESETTTTESTTTETTTTESETTTTETTTETTTTESETTTTESTTTETTTTESETTTTESTITEITTTESETTTTESTTTETTTTESETTTTESTITETTTTESETTTTESTTTETTTTESETATTESTTTETTTTESETTTTESTTTETTTTESETTTTESTTTETTTTESETTTTESTTTETTTTESETTTTESTTTESTTTETTTTESETTTTESTTTETTTTESETTTTESTTTETTTTEPTVTSYTYTVIAKAPSFWFSHDTSEFQPEDLIESITRFAVYSDGTVSETGEILPDLDMVSFDGMTPEMLWSNGGYVYAVSASITDQFGTQTIEAACTAYIGVKGDANLDGVSDAIDAAAVLTYAAAIGAGQDADLYSGTDESAENLAFFLAEVDGNANADAMDAAAILTYAAASGSGEPKSWEEILGVA